jgi:Cu-Zn family superoxide dismutase
VSTTNSLFLPTGKTHGAPSDDPSSRMVGDIGNIECDESGVATVKIEDSMVKLFGPKSVIGRSIVIFAGADDRGRGGQEKSLTTGNPGPRIACGVIGLSS